MRSRAVSQRDRASGQWWGMSPKRSSTIAYTNKSSTISYSAMLEPRQAGGYNTKETVRRRLVWCGCHSYLDLTVVEEEPRGDLLGLATHGLHLLTTLANDTRRKHTNRKSQ